MAEKKVTYLCVVRLLLDSTTALEGLFGEYHSSSAALGKRCLGVTKQPPHSPKGGCLVTPRHRLPSAADEEWYSPKRPSSAVVESNSSLTTQR